MNISQMEMIDVERPMRVGELFTVNLPTDSKVIGAEWAGNTITLHVAHSQAHAPAHARMPLVVRRFFLIPHQTPLDETHNPCEFIAVVRDQVGKQTDIRYVFESKSLHA